MIQDERDVTMREELWFFLTPQCPVFAGSSGRIMAACLLNGFSARTRRVKAGPLTVSSFMLIALRLFVTSLFSPLGEFPTELPLLEGHV